MEVNEAIECKVILFVGAYIPNNMNVVLESDIPIKLEFTKIDFYWGLELERFFSAQIDNSVFSPKIEIDPIRESIYALNKENAFYTIKIVINPLHIPQSDINETKKTPAYAYLQVVGFLLGARLEPFAIVYIPKGQKPIVKVKKASPDLIYPRAYTDRWKKIDFVDHFSKKLQLVWDNFSNYKPIQQAIEFYTLSLAKPYTRLRIVELVAGFERLRLMGGEVKSKKAIIDDFEQKHFQKLYVYRQIRDKLLHGGSFIESAELPNGQKVSIDYDNLPSECGSLLEEYILAVCSTS